MTAGIDGSRAAAALFERMDPGARPRLNVREQDGVPFLDAKVPGPFHVLFATRVGGESIGPYSGLNLDLRSADDPRVVERNRSRLEGILHLAGSHGTSGAEAGRSYRLVSPLQVHGLRVIGAAEYVAESAQRAGHVGGGVPCDGLTIHPELDRGLAPLLLFADCLPIVLVGEVDLAVIHGGWRGIIGGIVHAGARAMTGVPGLAVIGPSIGPCCFSVADEVADAFSRRFGPEVVLRDESSARVDLWAAAARSLAELNMAPSQIVNPRLCTSCNHDLFYSYRADGPVTGRQGCVVWAADS
ncbi:MAG: polyphenol oxidase family protein [Actinobacteria bacterium]|nr:polyphenol oxidase family protein [Actinomycetota bacterium]